MKQRPCRNCRAPFTVVNGGQRYCESCRQRRTAVLDRFDTLSEERKRFVFAEMLRHLAAAILLEPVEESEGEAIPPEQIPHTDQQAIDHIAGELLEGVDLRI